MPILLYCSQLIAESNHYVCVDHTDLLIAGSSHYVVSVSSQRSGSSVEVASVSSVTQVEQWRQSRSPRLDHVMTFWKW